MIRQKRFYPSLLFDDLNFDGRKEAIYQSSVYVCYIELNTASVSELDSLTTDVNYACGWDTVVGTTGCFRDYIGEQENEERIYDAAASMGDG